LGLPQLERFRGRRRFAAPFLAYFYIPFREVTQVEDDPRPAELYNQAACSGVLKKLRTK
jgi:hypothetical protein